jgi:hypothetical protein
MHERMDMHGALTLRLIDRDGNTIAEQHRKNRIVTAGRTLVAELFTGVQKSTSAVSGIAVGTDGTPARDDQTELVAQRILKELDASKTAFTVFEERTATGSVQRVRVTLQSELGFEEANDDAVPLREAGIFNGKGTMYNRVVFEPVVKTRNFKLLLLWEVTF